MFLKSWQQRSTGDRKGSAANDTELTGGTRRWFLPAQHSGELGNRISQQREQKDYQSTLKCFFCIISIAQVCGTILI